MTPRLLHCGESAISVQFSEEVDEAANRIVIALARDLSETPLAGVVECVPTYRSLLIRYDPEVARGGAIEEAVLRRCESIPHSLTDGGRLWRLPIIYGGPVGQDLDELARMKGISPVELTSLHADAEYRVYMIGFAPGFAYLGGLPEALHTPRLRQPRQNIPAGAVGIGGKQGNINSLTGPSGWRFIGRTPVRIFDPRRTEPFLLSAGDRVRFVAIDDAAAERMDAAAARGEMLVEPEGAI